MPNRSHKRDGFASFKSPDLITTVDALSSCDSPTRDVVNLALAPAPVIAVEGFDYTTLPPDLAERARETARRIHGVLQRAILQIGQELLAIKREMSHGTFTAWVNAEMGGMTLRTAQNYMKAARLVEGKHESVALLPRGLLYTLTSRSTPKALANEVFVAAETGNPMSAAEIRAKIKASKAECRTVVETKKPHQITNENTTAKSKRRVHVDRRTQAYQQRQAREEQERAERLTQLPSFVRRIGPAIGPQDLAMLTQLLTRGYRERIATRRLLETEIQPVLL